MKKEITIYQRKVKNVNFFEFGSLKFIDRILYKKLIIKLCENNSLYCLIKKPKWQIKVMAEESGFEFYLIRNVCLVKIDSVEKLEKLYYYLVASWNYYFLFSDKINLVKLLKIREIFLFNPKEEKFNFEIFKFVHTIGNLGHDDLVINLYTKNYKLEYLKNLLKGIIKKEFEFRDSDKQLFADELLLSL